MSLRMPDLATVYHVAVLALLVLGLAAVLASLACFDGLDPAAPPPAAEAPRVSILVPARNEERCIADCVGSLLAQDYPHCEFIVLDDHSSDRTRELLETLGFRPDHAQRRLLSGEPLPPGWVGKNWACHQLATTATGEFLIFADADTSHAPGMVSAAVAYAQRHNAALVSAWPRLITRTWGEALIIPMILLLGLTTYPHWLLRIVQNSPRLIRLFPARLRRSLGAGNGQLMIWRRSAYEQIGGHRAVRDHLVEDVALGRAVAARMAEGLRLFNCDALRFSRCRMYTSLPEVWEGFTKNLWPAFEGHRVAFLALGALQVCTYLLPCAHLFTLRGSPLWPFVVAQVALIYLTRAVLTWRFRTSWLSCALHPVAEVFCLAIGLNSLRLAGRRGVTWKGRRYAIAEPR